MVRVILILIVFVNFKSFSQNIATEKRDTTTVYISSTEKFKSSHIPDSVFQMINLKHLSINGMDCAFRIIDEKGNDITQCWMLMEIPKDIKNLKNLETISLTDHAITKIPEEIAELKQIKKLELSNNPALSDVEIIAKLESLEYLGLNGCHITELPNDLSYLRNLKKLGLIGNYISDSEKDRIIKALPNCRIYF